MQTLDLQKALKSKGFDPGPLDGKPGLKTLAAVKAFQAANGLEPDGVVGPKTLAALGAGPAAAPAPAVPAAAPGEEPPWLPIARSYLGLHEAGGATHNAIILHWWREIKNPWFKDDETPWCAGYVGGVLEEAGITSSCSAAAKSYLAWGQKLDRPQVGAIVVFTRTGGGHVGFVVGRDKDGHLMVLGGNQSDQVSIRPFGTDRVVGYRWPGGMAIPAGAMPLLASDGKVSTNEA